ncbi:MAG: hypothetical protein KJ587_08385 [Alphaproteobacteria bacterium]|nr:hypothetical protein [Alphaproteobacteria bacterium]
MTTIATAESARRLAEAMARAKAMQFNQPAQRTYEELSAESDLSLEERLFDVRAACKIEARKFSMLFEPDWHKKLFRQLDLLMDPEEWDSEDSPVSKNSFITFIRMSMILRNARRPGIGIANDGHILATWSIRRNDRLTVECLPQDRVRWIVSVPLKEETESAAGVTSLHRLLANLEPYKPEHWFAHERG